MKLKYYLRGLGIGIIVTALLMGFATKGGKELSDEEIKARAIELGMVEQRTLADIRDNAESGILPKGTEASAEVSAMTEALGKPEALQGTDDIPVTSQGTDMPAKTDTPATPRGTDIPAATETPQTPQATDIPETPRAQGTAIPAATETPQTPQATDIPETPQGTGMPATTETPMTPHGTDMPTTTDTPATHQGTDIPDTTEIPKTPQGTDIPQTPQDTNVIPVTPQIPQATDAPTTTKPLQGAEESQSPMAKVSGDMVQVTIFEGNNSVNVSRVLEEAGLVESAAAFDRYLRDNGYSKIINMGSYEIPMGTGEEEIAHIITNTN